MFLNVHLHFSSKPKNKLNTLESKLKHLYDTIREYREPKANRQLSFIFMKLPSKNVSTHPS